MRNVTVDRSEECLGPIEGGWSTTPEGDDLGYQIVRTRSTDGVTIFATLGVHRKLMRSRRDGRDLSLEFVLPLSPGVDFQFVPSIVSQVTSDFIARGEAPLRGDFLVRANPFFPGAKLKGIYFTLPIFLPNACHEFLTEEGALTAFVWLVPITEEEANFIRREGYTAFEAGLEEDISVLGNLWRDTIRSLR